MKPTLIKDLGMIDKTGAGKKRRYGLYECPMCNELYSTCTQDVKLGKSTQCRSCASTTHGESGHALRKIWISMKHRCNDKEFEYYGKSGITYDSTWEVYEEFKQWSYNHGYKEGLSIDRIDASKGYYPDNCRWVTMLTQHQNKRKLIATNTLGVRGVQRSGKKWRAKISNASKRISLGTFTTMEDAAVAYDMYVVLNKTEHPLNYPERREEYESKISLL